MKKKKENKASYSAASNSAWAAKMLLKYCPVAFFLCVILIPIEIGVQYLGIYLPSLVVQEVTGQQTFEHALLSVGIVMALLLAGGLLLRILGLIQTARLGIYNCKLTNLITRKKLSMFFEDYEKKSVRELASRAGRATEMWDGVQPVTDIIQNEFGIIKNVIGYFVFGTVISFASPWLLPLVTIGPFVNLAVTRSYNKWVYKHRQRVSELNGKVWLIESIPEDFTSAKDIRIYGMADWLRECFTDVNTERKALNRKMIKRGFASRIADLLAILIRDGGAYALLIAMVLKSEITIDQFVLYFAAVASMAAWVGGIINCWNGIHSASLNICDVRDYLEYPDRDGSGEAKSAEIAESPMIEFDNVSYRYDGAEEDTVKNLSFTIKKGEKLALVGNNGAGKTTVVKLLCGLYRPTKGEIRVDGRPITDFKRDDYYKLISPVFQDVRTAFFSLAETVSGAKEAETDIVKAEQCMRIAGLGEKIDSLPMGIKTKLDKQVDKDSTELSGGEKQKLMLARALYKDAPILVLDEPTAALDPIAESRIYTEYDNMCGGKTSLFISHRLASTSFCDKIMLLNNGQICETGTHAELMSLGGEYAKMFDIQSCWYKEKVEGGAEE